MLSTLCRPLTKALFFEQYIGKKAWYSTRKIPDYFESFLQLSNLDDLLGDSNLLNCPLSVYNSGSTVAVEANNVNELYDLLQAGNTLVFNAAHQYISQLTHVCESLSSELQATVQANIYVSPPGACQGLSLHYDSHDVIVLQLGGNKTWYLFDQCTQWPLNEAVNQSLLDSLNDTNAETFVLKQGDSLYLPAGVPHYAVSTNDYSIHVTLGLVHTRNQSAFQVLAEQAKQQAFFRQPFCLGDNDTQTANLALKEALHQLIDSTDFEQALASLYQKQRQANLRLNIDTRQAIRAEAMTANTLITVLAEWQLQCRGPFCFITLEETELSFPIIIQAFLQTVFNHIQTPRAINTIDSPLSDTLKVDVCKKLFLAGLLQISE